MVERCIRCEKQCTKFFSTVGGTVYVMTFLKSEIGIILNRGVFVLEVGFYLRITVTLECPFVHLFF